MMRENDMVTAWLRLISVKLARKEDNANNCGEI